MKKLLKISCVILGLLQALLNNSCQKDSSAPLLTISTITTTAVSAITQNSAISGGEITSDGGASVTARGVCWSTGANPTIADIKTVDGSGTGQFASGLNGLTYGTVYHIRAYATNSMGTAYGEDVTFTTISSNPVTDADGNSYNILTIGAQVWMKENLKTTKYNDGTPIPNVTNDVTWSVLTTGAYCDYGNAPSNASTYGRLYNWYSLDITAATKMASNGGKNICPTGWHVPSETEWITLAIYLGGENISGGKLKEAGTVHWHTPNAGADNAIGFTALPGGYRTYDDGSFRGIGYYSYWWSTTEGKSRSIYYNDGVLNRDYTISQDGFSVRCLHD